MSLFGTVRTTRYIVPRFVRSKSIFSSLRNSRVLISSSDDIYTNLAIEHWLYTNLKFSSKAQQADIESPIVFLWTNSPSVVIGKHQNPWLESTMGFVERAGIKLARRFSGGGCVYHDENNINISVIGNRDVFASRQENLRFLANFLKARYGLHCETSPRHDLRHTSSGLKLSGSASRLGTKNSYHHFTLLVDTDKEVMMTAIRQKNQDFIRSSSTSSVRGEVINLRELRQDIDTQTVLHALAQEYGKELRVPTPYRENLESTSALSREDLESLSSMIDKLRGWEWIYGQTPRFKLESTISLHDEGLEKQVKFIVEINKGRYESFSIEGDSIKDSLAERFNHLVGVKFNYKESVPLVAKMFNSDDITHAGSMSIGLERVFATHLLQMIHGANY